MTFIGLEDILPSTLRARFPDTKIGLNGSGNHLYGSLDALTFERHNECTMTGDRSAIVLHDHASLRDCRLIVEGSDSRIVIGPRCRLRSTTLKIRGDGCRIEIGGATTIEEARMLCQEDGCAIVLGEDCMLSEGIFLRTSDSHGIIDIATGARINPPGDIILGSHVWLGRDVKINKGVRVGSGSIVAQNALMTKDVPENCTVGGNPARVLREGVTWTRSLKPPAG